VFGSERVHASALAVTALGLVAFSSKPVAPAVGPAATPTLITVPPGLKARSRTIEPSGVAWVKALDRYLVVSDDTGDSDDHHQPWLLAMTRGGVFDEAPVPIEGIPEINDGESLAAGPDGVLFLVTSHSPNKRGHTSTARSMLLLLEVTGRAVRVTGRLDLTAARTADGGGSLLGIAGLPEDGRLDIEAVSFRDGALLIGLKSPLTARAGAVVLRLASPVEALRAGKLPAGAVTRLWELPLAVTDKRIPQGIADLTSLPDGSVIVVANSPKGREADGGGALYHFAPDKGATRLLQRFEGLHPEGVTMSADGKELVIVFDTNEKPPLWMRWPLPPRSAK
jgi:hypothetical protein